MRGCIQPSRVTSALRGGVIGGLSAMALNQSSAVNGLNALLCPTAGRKDGIQR
jgi:hypothetical protein